MYVLLIIGESENAPEVFASVRSVPTVGSHISLYMTSHIPISGKAGLGTVIIVEELAQDPIPCTVPYPTWAQGNIYRRFLCKPAQS